MCVYKCLWLFFFETIAGESECRKDPRTKTHTHTHTHTHYPGVSMMYTFKNQSAETTRETQYFEMLGNQGIYQDGWTAQTTPIAAPWVGTAPDADPITGYKWELYHVAEDPTQSKDLAEECPAKLAGEYVCVCVCVCMYVCVCVCV